MTDLRSRQRELALQSILDACAALVTERRHLDFTMKEVAERAGVSLRTVYNHFAAREDLLDALGTRFDEEMAELGGPDTTDLQSVGDLRVIIPSVLSLFEQLGGISEAFAQMPLADAGRHPGRAARTEALVTRLEGFMAGVPEADAHMIAVGLRHMISHRSWFWLTREYGLDTDQAIRLVDWVAVTLIDAALAGNTPTRLEES